MSNSLSSKVFSGMFWKFSERILAQFISFIVTLVIARILSPSEYGLVAMAMIFINIANVFVSNGFNAALIQKKDSDEIDFSTLFYCSLLISVALYAALYLVSPLIAQFYENDSLTNLLRVFGLILPLSSYKSIQNAWVSKRLEFRKFFFSTLGGTLVSAVVGILMAVKGFGVWALVAQYFTNAVVDSLVLTFTISWHPKFLFSLSSAKSLLSYGTKILGSDLIGVVYNQLNSFFVAKKYLPSDLAFYTKGKQFPDLIDNNIGTAISSALFPAFSLKNDDYNTVVSMCRRAVQVSCFVLVPFYFGLAAVAENLVNVLLTSKWSPCVPFLRIMCLGGILNSVGIIDIQLLKAIGKAGTVLKIEFIKKPLFLAILIFSLRFNIYVLAFTVPVTALIANIVNGICVQKFVGYTLFQKFCDFCASFFIALCMGAAVYLLNFVHLNTILLLFLQVLAGAVLYVLLAFLSKNKSFYYVLNFLKEKKSERRRA